jgi:hypothetical protein
MVVDMRLRAARLAALQRSPAAATRECLVLAATSPMRMSFDIDTLDAS